MNRQAKSAIKSLVLTLRHKLEDEIAIQLKRYGFAGERWLPVERLPHIQRNDRATIDHFRLKTALEQHLRRIGAEPNEAMPQQRAEAAGWFVREVAFTHLNRLAALKCLEVRDLIPEIVTVRDAYGGRSRAHYDYRNDHPDEARRPDDALPAALRHVCQQVYAEFRFLFDVGDPATGRQPPANSILWPDYPVLKECIQLINDLDKDAGHEPRNTLWAEDEIIGWIYQFYNAEQKEAIRRRGRPRRPAEVAVINQFFTPRWICKFLVDNTLGRLWLEMHPDSERVRAKCDYLVPEPLPAENSEFGVRDSEPAIRNSQFAIDPDSPVNDPKAPPRREPKSPQEVRLIDPACGTMHFGHYAFEVFQEIYRDARDHDWVTGDDVLPDEEIPAAILRHNLYGVDIDLRAVQLAGLSLFIKAKLALHALSEAEGSQVEGTAMLKAHISHVNLVVADAVLPADGARQGFLERYRDDLVVQDAVRQVLDEMANVAEVGSLLRVEERLRDILGKAGHAAVQHLDAERQRGLPGFEPPTRQLSLAEAAGAAPEEWGAHYTLARLLDDLRAFAAEALQTHDLNAQLFAQEAEKTVHLLDVFLNDYDVVVMNPPYGNPTPTGKRYIVSAYPRTWNDIYGSFIERSEDLVRGRGYTGVLCSRTFMFLSRFERVRKYILENAQVIALLETGVELLDDATVRPAAVVLGWPYDSWPAGTWSFFARLGKHNEDYYSVFTDVVQSNWGKGIDYAYWRQSQNFLGVPAIKWTYWISDDLLWLFKDMPSFEPTAGIARAGCSTGDDPRFVRYHWEIAPSALDSQWKFFNKGGGYSPYYMHYDLVVNWSTQAIEIMSNQGNRLASRRHYFKHAISWPRISEKGASFRIQPANMVFSDKGPVFIPVSQQDGYIWKHLGLLKSRLLEGLLLALSHERSIDIGSVRSLPYVIPTEPLGLAAKQAHNLKATWDTGNEICTRSNAPWLVQTHRGTLLAGTIADGRPLIAEPGAPNLQSPISNLHSLLDYLRAVEQAADARLQTLQAQIDEVVYELYEISTKDRALIERELGDRPPELVWPQMAGKSDREKRREHVRRLISHFLLQALKEKRDGVLPLTPGTGQPTALDEVRRRMETEFGEAAAFRMETEIRQVLGRDVEAWLDRDFFKWHVRLYKRRPVVWHLASPGNAFACFLHIHKLDKDTLRKVQTLYLWPRRRAAEAELESAKAAKSRGERGAARRIEGAETVLDDLAEFEKRLLAVVQAQVACEIPDWAERPFRDGVYDPVLDDGVKVNITPLQAAGLLRQRRVV